MAVGSALNFWLVQRLIHEASAQQGRTINREERLMDPVRLLHMANVYRHEFSLAREAGDDDAQAHTAAQVAADLAGVEWDRVHSDPEEVRRPPTDGSAQASFQSLTDL
jgi:hypothetical protein